MSRRPLAIALLSLNSFALFDLASTPVVAEPSPESASSATAGAETQYSVQTLPIAQGWEPLSAMQADLDDDGAVEIVVGEVSVHGSSRLRVLRGGQASTCFGGSVVAGRFAELQQIPISLRPDLLLTADLDGDGRPDLAYGEVGERRIEWLPGPVMGSAAAASRLDLPAPLRLAVVADVDRPDGLGDLLVAMEGEHGSDHLRIYRDSHGVAHAQPEQVELPSPITKISAGQLRPSAEGSHKGILVEAAGQPWLVEGGRQPVFGEARGPKRLARAWPRAFEDASRGSRWRPQVRVRNGHVELVRPRGSATFRVNSLFDFADADPLDGICDTAGLPDPSGLCTLRAAIEQANASAGADQIQFNLPGPGPHELPIGGPGALEITEGLFLDGTSQQGYAGSPVIELTFAGGGVIPGLDVSGDDVVVCGLSITGFPAEGIAISGDLAVIEGNWIGLDPTTTPLANLRGIATSGSIGVIGYGLPGAGNVVSGNTTGGIFLGTGTENSLMSNLVGTDPTGLSDMPNGGLGVRVDGNFNTIGGSKSLDANVISANISVGLWLAGDDNLVQRNKIGVDITGSAPLGNGFAGIFVDDGADRQQIGGPGVLGNNISGNIANLGGFGGSGIVVRGSDSTRIQGNQIGGLGALGNDLHGIHVEKVSPAIPRNGLIGGPGILGNLIGGNGIGGDGGHGVLLEEAEDFLVAGNFIGISFLGIVPLGNLGDGVRLVESTGVTVGGAAPGAPNFIGRNTGNGIAVHDLDSSAGLQNTNGNLLSRNGVAQNGGLAIDLTRGGPVADGPTANDDDDPDFGPNRLQNFPGVEPPERVGGTTSISGTLSSEPLTTYRIELFDNTECDPSGFGEATFYLGSVDVTTDGSGEAPFLFTTPMLVTFPTATATNLATADTSELSPCSDTVLPGGGILGDRVWEDDDADGLQALGEPGVPGITVRLLDGTTQAVLATTITDQDGAYRFVGLSTGTYRISVVAPPGAVFTLADEGLDDTIDSDIDPATGISDAFLYTADTVDLSRDAGLSWRIFYDDFETGNLSRWGNMVP